MFKKILAYALTVCLLVSTMISPAYAVDEVYSVTDDTVPAPAIYYTDGYTPGMYAGLDRSMSVYGSASYGSYSSYGYTPTGFDDPYNSSIRQWSFVDYAPVVTDGTSSVSATTTIPSTYFLTGSLLTVNIPSTQDAYFDFQSSNILFDQSSSAADTFYLNGSLSFYLRNQWSFVSGTSDYDDVSFFRASDPLAVQLLINGKPYGDIVDVTTYTSPFTATHVGSPALATVTFDNLKVYYQGDTPELIGFRIYTGSAYGQSSYLYGDYEILTLQNLISFQWTQQPDITFVQENTGSDYTGDLSGIQSVLSSVSQKLTNIFNQLTDASNSNTPYLFTIRNTLNSIKDYLLVNAGTWLLDGNGSFIQIDSSWSLDSVIASGFMGIARQLKNSAGTSYLALTYDRLGNIFNQLTDSSLGNTPYLYTIREQITYAASRLQLSSNSYILNSDGSTYQTTAPWSLTSVVNSGLMGLASLSRNAQSYVANTVFPWRSYNMDTHQLNAATNVTGQNNLFFTAFQSIEDKLGRLAYVFGSDEDLKLKDEADPGTDAFRENFGGGLSLGQISDGKDVVEGVSGLLDSGYSFGDAFTEIAGEDFLFWFSPECAAALDSTGSVMALDDSDPYNMQPYYDHVQKVKEKREAGDN